MDATSGSGESSYQKVATDLSGAVYVVVTITEPNSVQKWVVRKSTDGGVSWDTVDDYQFSALLSSQANDVFIDSARDVFIAGDAYDSSNLKHWIVRKTTDAGSSWSGIDDYLRVGGSNKSSGLSIIGNSGGVNLAVVGWGLNGQQPRTPVLDTSEKPRA